MDSETLEGIQVLLNEIDIEDEPESEKNKIYFANNFREYHKPTLRYTPKKYVNFEQYVKENCNSKITILDREKFHSIERPIVIFFNHFREMCAYHTDWLDKLYQLALKYGDSIEFIAADMIDIDIMYPGRNPMTFFCYLIRPDCESPNTFAIDEKKRIYEYFDAYKTVTDLSEVCKNLLDGSLFQSELIPENNETNLVKKCVHHNYEELILNSTKNIFLIINLEDCQFYDEPSYEHVALAFEGFNLEIVYMLAVKNYIPFEYHANSYPTILFIPFNDKNNFIYYQGQRQENLIIDYLKNILQKPEILQLEPQKLKSRMAQKLVDVKSDFQMDFNDLPQFFKQNYKSTFKVLDRKILERGKRMYIIIFMDFSQNKCLAQHIKWLNEIYQFVETCYACEIFVADFKDIDIINTRWKPCDIKSSAQGRPRVYAIDYLKHSYEFGNFYSPAALYYFTQSVQSRQYYYSQMYDRKNMKEKVKVWTADYFNIFVKCCKKHIFITFYSSEDENAEKILNLLEQTADDIADLNVEIATLDIQHNYVDLEYAHDSYPVFYFIPESNKRLNRHYADKEPTKEKILEFVISNLQIK